MGKGLGGFRPGRGAKLRSAGQHSTGAGRGRIPRHEEVCVPWPGRLARTRLAVDELVAPGRLGRDREVSDGTGRP